MSRILKPHTVELTEEVVLIPDNLFMPKVEIPDGDPEEEAPNAEAIYESMIQRAQQDAQQAADKILALANQQQQELLKKAMEDAKQIKSDAQQQGYQEAFESKKTEIEKALRESKALLEQLRSEQQEYMETYASELKSFSLEIASRVLFKRISTDETELAGLVEHVISTIREAKWISVQISNRLPGLVSYLEQELQAKDFGGARVQVDSKEIPEDSVIIQTSEGQIDASLSTQMENLQEFFNQGQD